MYRAYAEGANGGLLEKALKDSEGVGDALAGGVRGARAGAKGARKDMTAVPL